LVIITSLSLVSKIWGALHLLPAPHYQAPGGGTYSSLNLSRPGQRSYGLFIYPEQRAHPQLLRYLGSDLQRQLTVVDRSALETSLGVTLLETQLARVIEGLLVHHAQATGQDRWKPCPGSRRYGFGCWLGGLGRLQFQSGQQLQLVVDLFRADYRASRPTVSNQQELDQLRRCTGYVARRWKLAPGDLLPPEYESDGWLPPATTITESFDQTDSDILGPDLTWAEVSGNDYETITNQCEDKANGKWGSARAESSLSGADHYALADVTYEQLAGPEDAELGGVAVRYQTADTTTETFYGGGGDPLSAQDKIQEVTAGSHVNLATQSHTGLGNSTQTVKLEIDGSDLTLTVGLSTLNASDASITGNLRAGIFGFMRGAGAPANHKWDDFEAADLPAGGLAHSRGVIIG
jgi:hypothetical protein